MASEDELGWEYFGGDPENSPRMQAHMDWHNAPENQNRTGNYGERFLDFHQNYVAQFDVFRVGKGLLPVSAWDPSTPIPANLDHPHVLMDARATSNPASVDPACKTPSWATLAGGTVPDPLYGHTSLGQFQSLDELGRSIDDGWHGTVHNTIGGDMATFMSPIDPVFWRWHKWIDNVRAAWAMRRRLPDFTRFLSLVRVLYGVINDAPGVVIGPDGRPHPVPGGPGDPWWASLAPASRDILLGVTLRELGHAVATRELGAKAQSLGVQLMKSGLREME